jgi:hypothetical protein
VPARVTALVGATGELHTAQDFENAALVMQHTIFSSVISGYNPDHPHRLAPVVLEEAPFRCDPMR